MQSCNFLCTLIYILYYCERDVKTLTFSRLELFLFYFQNLSINFGWLTLATVSSPVSGRLTVTREICDSGNTYTPV